jgi:hypothetical protein
MQLIIEELLLCGEKHNGYVANCFEVGKAIFSDNNFIYMLFTNAK